MNSISIVDLLRNDDLSIDDWSSILRSSIYRVFNKGVIIEIIDDMKFVYDILRE